MKRVKLYAVNSGMSLFPGINEQKARDADNVLTAGVKSAGVSLVP